MESDPMKWFRVLCGLLILSCSAPAAESLSVADVIHNVTKDGVIPLDQGYRGSFVFAEGSYLVDEQDRKSLEFTHAFLNDTGVGDKAPKAQAIAVGLKGGGTMYPAIHLEKIPAIKDLMALGEIGDFEKIFGPFRGLATGEAGEKESYSSLDWKGFIRAEDGSLRVVSVFLWTVNRGEGWRIQYRQIGEGLFKPTGKPPVPEDN